MSSHRPPGVTASQLVRMAECSGGHTPVLVFYGQRRIVWHAAARSFVGQRQDRPLASWETVVTTRDAEHAALWLNDATLPSIRPYGHPEGRPWEGWTPEAVDRLMADVLAVDDEQEGCTCPASDPDDFDGPEDHAAACSGCPEHGTGVR